MSLASSQGLITVSGSNLISATKKLDEALSTYSNARIVSLTSQNNWATSFGRVTILAAIEFTPAPGQGAN
jgi:hypothetical protein